MGASCTRDANAPPPVRSAPAVPVPVALHVYDLGTSGGASFLNRMLRPMGTGAFHCGVEVHGWEWSFSDIANPIFKSRTGIFCCQPRACEGHTYYQSVSMGKTRVLDQDVLELVSVLEKDWLVSDYDVLKKNCCHFCEELCKRLGVGAIPAWVTSLAGAGASLAAGDFTDTTCCRMMVPNTMCCKDSHLCNGQEELIESMPAISQVPPLNEVQLSEFDSAAEQVLAASELPVR